jgi:hypothetical protein
MDTFSIWLQQFITSKGRSTSSKQGNLGQRFFCVVLMDKQLYLESPEFKEWLQDKQKEFDGLQQLKQGHNCNMTFKRFNKQIKTKLINPMIGNTCDDFLKELNVALTEPEDGYPVSTIRITPRIIMYGFKKLQDCESMANFLVKHGIDFNFDTNSKGARYEYHFIINRS